MKMMLSFSKDEVQVMDSRLSVPDCIAEALTDHDPAFDPIPPYTHAEAMAAADRLWNELSTRGTLTIASQVERDVVEDAVDGSTFGYFVKDAVADGDMTKAEAAKWRRAMRSIITKLKPLGIAVAFPEN